MIGDIFNLILYQPLYNGLVFLISVIPFGDVGVAVILLTLIVKLALFPFTHKSVKSQSKLRSVEPEVQKVKDQYKDNKQEQAKKVMELYKKHGVNPFSGCLLFLVQIPVIIALYWVFWKGVSNGLSSELLYSFVTFPESINMKFLNLIDMSGKSLILAAIAGGSQYFQMKYAMPKLNKKTTPRKDGKMNMKDEFMRNFQLQMKYGLPVFVFFISYTISAAVALYWATSNLFSISHELLVKRKARKLINDLQPTTDNQQQTTNKEEKEEEK